MKSMRLISRLKRSALVRAVSFCWCLALTVAGGLRADDSEIYVEIPPRPPVPSVLFNIDTSQSMTYPIPEDENIARMTAFKEALTGLIEETPNLNAGLSRYHPILGASIIFPVTALDEVPTFLNENIILSTIDSSSDDAEEDALGQVVLDEVTLELGDFVNDVSINKTTLAFSPINNNDDDEVGEEDPSHIDSRDLDLGSADAGVRFPDIAIPKNALILHAEVVFHQTNRTGSDRSSTTHVMVYGHDVDNSPAFVETESDPNSLQSRLDELTRASVGWSNIRPTSQTASIYTRRISTPNVRSIIQEIVNRDNWVSGNALTLIFEAIDGHREVDSTNANAGEERPPELRITYELPGTTLLQRRANSNKGDAEEDSGTNVNTSDPEIGLMQDLDGTNTLVGFSFPNVSLPDAAEIVWADIEFDISTESITDPFDVKIHGVLEADPGIFEDMTGTRISNRPLTGNATNDPKLVTWISDPNDPVDPLAALDNEEIFKPRAGERLYTPNLASLIDRIINPPLADSGPDFVSGNSMAFVFEDDTSDGGINKRIICSVDSIDSTGVCSGNQAAAPKLRIFYTTPTFGVTDTQHIGLRFNNIQVPQGAEITQAQLEFTVDAATNRPGKLRIEIENSIAPDSYSSTTNNITGRSYTNGLDWDTTAWTAPDGFIASPDISDLVDDITDIGGSSGWCGGGSLAFKISQNDDTADVTRLLAKSWDQNPDAAPRLRIRFDTTNLADGEGCVSNSTVTTPSLTGEDLAENSNGIISTANTAFKINNALSPKSEWVGIRFPIVNIPKGATITNASLRFVAAGTAADNDGEMDFIIYAQQHANAQQMGVGADNLSNRVVSGDPSVDWDVTEDWVVGQAYNSPDVSSLIQNIIDGDDLDGSGQIWESGNALVFLMTEDTDSPNGSRRFATCCGAGTPRLEVSYTIDASILDTEPITGRQAIMSIIEDFQANDPIGTTVTVDSLFETASYFSGSEVYFGRTRGAGPSLESIETREPNIGTNLHHWLVNQDTGENRADSTLLAVTQVPGWDPIDPKFTRLSHFASYTDQPSGEPANVIREGVCTAFNPNSTDCHSEHVDNDHQVFYISPIDKPCEKGHIVLVTDGETNANSSTSLIPELAGIGSCTASIPEIDEDGNPIPSGTGFMTRPPGEGEICGIEVAKYLYETDFFDEGAGNEPTDTRNNVSTFTVGFNLPYAANDPNADGLDADTKASHKRAQEFLKALAFVGNGGDLSDPDANPELQYGDGFVTATNAIELKNAFFDILAEVIQDAASAVAPGISVNAFNRLFNQTEVYFALFRPEERSSWHGNLKKFKLCTDEPDCDFGEVIDKHDEPAVFDDFTDLETFGNLKPTAVGFWSADTDTAGSVLEGGVGEKMPDRTSRNVYLGEGGADLTPAKINLSTDIVADADLGTLNDDGIRGLLLSANNCDEGTDNEKNVCLNNLIKWMMGQKFENDLPRNGEESDENRWAFGDPMHSQPLVLTYDFETDANGDKVLDANGNPIPISRIFVGTNDGGFHMIDEASGVENWVFFPNSMLSRQSDLKANELGPHTYGVDGVPVARINDVDGDGVLDTSDGDFIHVFFGMRRGGNQIFALDVTATMLDPNEPPVLLWRIDGGDGVFTYLGQTWSTLRPTQIFTNQGPRSVLIFGGGYTPQQDGEDEDGIDPDDGDNYQGPPSLEDVPGSSDDAGNGIYIVDAGTGELIWWATNRAAPTPPAGEVYIQPANVAEMNAAIAAPLTLLSADGDPYTDLIYAVDMRGQVFRIDLALKSNPAEGESELSNSKVGVLARLGDIAKNENRRKFFYAPEVARVNDKQAGGGIYNLIAIVSGNRANPKGISVLDRAYGIRDYLADEKQTNSNFPACNPLDCVGQKAGPILHTTPTETDLVDTTDTFIIRKDDGANLEVISNDTLLTGDAADDAIDELKENYGWYFDLEGTNVATESTALTGEKGFSTATVLDSKMFFTTYLPPDQSPEAQEDICSFPQALGTSRFYAIDVFTGAPAFPDFNPVDNFQRTDRFKNFGGGPSADIVPAFLPGGATLPVPTGAGAVAQDPRLSSTAIKTFWFETR